jgi:hypothetical protein
MDIWDLGVGSVISFTWKRIHYKVVSSERGQTIAVVCCMNTARFGPLATIFLRRRMKPELFKKPPEGTIPMTPECGFVNLELFDDWL